MDAPKITSVDAGIIRCLHGDARKPLAKIAEELGVPESTVRHRLHRLVRHGIVRFAAVTDPLRMGYQIWAVIEIQGEPSRLQSIADELAKVREVQFVGITTGDCDVLVTAVFRSNAELLQFLTRTLTRIRGVTRTSTSTLLAVVKRTLTVDVPEPPPDRGAPAKRTETPAARAMPRQHGQAVTGPRRAAAPRARSRARGSAVARDLPHDLHAIRPASARRIKNGSASRGTQSLNPSTRRGGVP